MEWILYIIGGVMLVGFLWGIGLIPEFLAMIGTTLMVGLISGTVAWMFDWGFGSGFQVGIYIGVALYTLYCIGRIVNPNITIEFYTDGSSRSFSERGNGIIGLIVVVGSMIWFLYNYWMN